jgi:hypothetical protein
MCNLLCWIWKFTGDKSEILYVLKYSVVGSAEIYTCRNGNCKLYATFVRNCVLKSP